MKLDPKLIIELYKTKNVEEISRQLKTSDKNISSILKENDVKIPQFIKWSEEELLLLKQNYSSPDFSYDLLPNRSEAAIQEKAKKLELKRYKPQGKTQSKRYVYTCSYCGEEYERSLINKKEK